MLNAFCHTLSVEYSSISKPPNAAFVSPFYAVYWKEETPRDDWLCARRSYLRELTRHLQVQTGERVLVVGECSAAAWVSQRLNCAVAFVDSEHSVHMDDADVGRCGSCIRLDLQDLDEYNAHFDHAIIVQKLDGELLHVVRSSLKEDGQLALALPALNQSATWFSRQLLKCLSGSEAPLIDDCTQLFKHLNLELLWMEDVSQFTVQKARVWLERQEQRPVYIWMRTICGERLAWLRSLAWALAERHVTRGYWGLYFLWLKKGADE